jgi:hypothetical protein
VGQEDIMIKKMTHRAMDPETKNFKERTAHDPCTFECFRECGRNPEIPEAQIYSTIWFPF